MHTVRVEAVGDCQPQGTVEALPDESEEAEALALEHMAAVKAAENLGTI